MGGDSLEVSGWITAELLSHRPCIARLDTVSDNIGKSEIILRLTEDVLGTLVGGYAVCRSLSRA